MKQIKVILLCLICACAISSRGFCLDKEEEKFYIAAKAFSDNFYDASASLFKRFIEEYPQSKKVSEANLYIAKCLYFKEDYPKAMGMLESLVNKPDAKPFYDEAYYWLAETYVRGKNFKNALGFSQKIIAGYPDSKFYWWAYDIMAKCYLELGNDAQAQAIFKKIIEECKEKELIESAYIQLLNAYYQHKEKSDIVQWAQNYLTQYPHGNFSPKAYFYLADGLLAQKEYDKAISYFNKALETPGIEPIFSDVLYQGLVFAYTGKENREEAQKCVDKIQSEELRVFTKGMYYFTIKDYSRALEAFDSFLAKFPHSAYAVSIGLNKADTFYEMGRINDSLGAYRSILDKASAQKDFDVVDKAHYGLAWGYLRNGEFKKAIDEFKNTLKFTDNPIVKISSQIQIADVYQESENYTQALDIYNEILRSAPNTVYADYIQFQIGMVFLKTKKIEESFLAFRNLQKNFPTSKLIPQAQYYLAVGYFSMDSYPEAKRLLEEFAAKFPQHDLSLKAEYLYGKCFFNEKDYSSAIDIFKGILGKFKDPELEGLVYIDLGNAFLNLEQFDKAKSMWEEFLVQYPGSQFAGSMALSLGGVYEKEGNIPQAQKYYMQVIDTYAHSMWADEATLSLADLYWRQGNIEKAEEYFTSLSGRDTPIAVRAKFYLAQLYAQKGKTQEALKLFNELIDSPSAVAKIALLEKAFLLKDLKDYSQAIVSFRHALEAGLDSARLRFFLAFSYEKLDKNKEATDEFYRVIYTFPDNEYKINAYFHIAKIYEKTNRLEAARGIYQKIISLNTEDSALAQEKLHAISAHEK